MRKNGLWLIGIILLCGTLFYGFWKLSQAQIFIKQIDNSSLPGNLVQHTINVAADGKVFAMPDTMDVVVSVSEIGKSTKLAQDAANKKIDQITEIAKTNGVDPKDIQTSSLSVYPEYDYYNGLNTLKGYRSTHTLTVKIKKTGDDFSKGSDFIDGVAAVGNVQVQSVSFDIDDKTVVFQQARELAFAKAKQKAEQLAKLSDLKLLKPLNITEDVVSNVVPYPINYARAEMKTADSVSPSTSLEPGQMEITINLNVLFGIE